MWDLIVLISDDCLYIYLRCLVKRAQDVAETSYQWKTIQSLELS